MKKITKKQIKVICHSDAETFEAEFNQAMTLLADKSPEAKFSPMTDFCAYIEYETEETIIESAEDEMKAQGIHLYCMDCPYLEHSDDKRITKHICQIDGIRHSMNSSACSVFYEKVKAGEVQPVRPDEHKQEIRKILIEREARKSGASEDEISDLRNQMRVAEADRQSLLPEPEQEKPVIKFGSKKITTKTEAKRIEDAKQHAAEWRMKHLAGHGAESNNLQNDFQQEQTIVLSEQDDNCPEYLKRARAYYQQKNQ